MEYIPSRFVQKTLMPDEHCIKDARFSWVYNWNAAILGLMFLPLGYATHLALGILPQYSPSYLLYCMIVSAVAGGWFFLAMMIEKWTTEIVLTNHRLIYKRGLFWVKLVEVDIEQLASDNVEQSLWGRLFNFGAINVRCIEANDILLPPVTHPYEFRNALEEQKRNYRDTYMKVERLRHHGRNPGER